jgi:fructosamine-3-kinase
VVNFSLANSLLLIPLRDIYHSLQDPATYYGDREADLAMTYLFGAFPDTFYQGYEEEWPLPPGFANRRTIYNLYHILNHYVLFGGGYAPQAQRMMDQIMKINM